jgi:hypothetical protein
MIRRGRRPGRYRPTVMAAAAATAGAALLVSGCTRGGDDRAAGQSDAAATVTEEGIPPPPGHVGLWFGTEPWGPLDHLVWASQRYIGDPVAVPPVGDRAKGPEARDLPDVCDQRVVDRMVELGLRAGAEPYAGLGLVQCSARGAFADNKLGGIGFFWGSVSDVRTISGGMSGGEPDNQGTEVLSEGGFADDFGCVGIRRPFSTNGAVFIYFGSVAEYKTCSEVKKATQIVFNVLGGDLVQI